MKTQLDSLALLALLYPLSTSSACGSKDEVNSAPGGDPVATAPSAARAEKANALAKAWEADANCKALSTCCASLAGTTWEQTLTPFCGQVAKLQDFNSQAQSMVDPGLQSKDCQNRVQMLAGMANASNPLPDGCAPR